MRLLSRIYSLKCLLQGPALLLGLLLCGFVAEGLAAPALEKLGRDFEFPNKIEGFPSRISEFPGLQINHFRTSDGVELAYWEAGTGRPLVFIPGWSANGAQYFNVLYLLSRDFHVYVLDPRNQGLSQHVEFGGRIARYAADLREFIAQAHLDSANFCGWSMGAAVLWSYVDLFGTRGINKLIFVDEPVSIYAHADWSEQERADAGGMTSSPERMIAAFLKGAPASKLVVDMSAVERAAAKDSPYYVNSESFAAAFVKDDPVALGRVLFDHISNDWRDVVSHKFHVPVAIFTGDYSSNLQSQRWLHSQISGSKLFVYSKEEHGDHFLMFKNPLKFSHDLRLFLEE